MNVLQPEVKVILELVHMHIIKNKKEKYQNIKIDFYKF